MRRKINRWLCGTVVALILLSVHFLLSSFCAENVPDERSRGSNEDYIGLDGETSALRLWCSTCAIVGASGHLVEHEYGSEIDEKHSCVFRMGFSPNRGMERHVGARTTARIVDSFSFFPFLKRPWKLVTGPFTSEAWILFDRRPGDISWYHRPLLSDLVQKYDSKFLWMTKRAEGEVHQFMKNQTFNIRVTKISALWFALKVIRDAGCTSLSVYGIPDHQICKRSMNVSVPSLYWNNSSAPICLNGIDASFASGGNISSVSDLPTVAERRILWDWKPDHLTSIHFQSPKWPS